MLLNSVVKFEQIVVNKLLFFRGKFCGARSKEIYWMS